MDHHSAAVLKKVDFIISYKFGTVRLKPKGQLKKSTEGNKDQPKGGTLAGASKSTRRKGVLQPKEDKGAPSSQLPKGKSNWQVLKGLGRPLVGPLARARNPGNPIFLLLMARFRQYGLLFHLTIGEKDFGRRNIGLLGRNRSDI